MSNPTKVSKLQVQYLDLLNQPPFTFIVNQKEYKCNSFGVKASKIINDLLYQDPTIREYVYDFDDPNKDFQQICNFFNFQKILITTKNMNSLLQIAKDLKIDIVIDDVSNFIDSYESIVQQSEVIDEIFNLLYNIPTFSVESVKNSIIDSIWVTSEENIQELAAIILQVVQTSYQLQPFIIELLLLLEKCSIEKVELKFLIPIITSHLFTSFSSSKFYCSFVYRLWKSGLIQIEKILDKICEDFIYPNKEKSTKKENGSTKYVCYYNYKDNDTIYSDMLFKNNRTNAILWFFPELIEMKHISIKVLFDYMNEQERKFIHLYYPNNPDNFKKMRESGQPDDEIIQALIHDDVDSFQSIISKRHINVNLSEISPNLFEVFDNKIKKKFIDYACKYGAISCFKYLLLNHANINKLTLGFAVYGGNVEIIRIVDQQLHNQSTKVLDFSKRDDENNKKKKNYGKNIDSASIKYSFDENFLIDHIIPSIVMHRYEIFDWILESNCTDKQLNDTYLIKLANISVKSGNIHSFIRLIDNGLILSNIQKKLLDFIGDSATRGFYRFAKLLLSFNTNENYDLIQQSIYFGNLSILKLFYEENPIKYKDANFKSFLSTPIKRDFMKIVKYIIEEILNLDNNQLFSLFLDAISAKSFKTADCFENKINIHDIKNNKYYDYCGYKNILEISCTSGYLKIVKKITEILLEVDQKIDFTHFFLKAATSGSEEICQYFIDKKVSFKTFNILQNYNILDIGMGKILFNLINNADLETREEFSRIYLNEAIKKGNKNLVDLLINKNSMDNQALFDAVKTHDLELVNKILDCKNKPSFINQISESGTALFIAVQNNDIEIVKRLLSIPGIDPNLCIKDKITPLIQSIDNLNIEMVNIILDFYGDKIQSYLWQINKSLIKLFSKLKNKADSISHKNILIILEKLVNIKNIDLNFYCGNETLLIFACQNNEYDLVQILLKSENIDVNLYETITGNSPLITAVENRNIEIAELLISHPQTNINFKNNFLKSAFKIAVAQSLDEIVSLLINHEKFDQDDNDIDDAFFSANESMSKELIKLKNLNVNYSKIYKPYKGQKFYNSTSAYLKNRIFESTLMNAVNNSNKPKIELILNHPSFDPVKSQLKQAIFEQNSIRNIEIFRILWAKLNYDINICSQYGVTLFFLVLNSGSLDVICEMLSNGNNKIDKKYLCDAIIKATFRFEGSFQVLISLYDYDQKNNHYIDFNEVFDDGRTFLTSISTYSSDEIGKIVKFMLDHGADPNIPNKNGEYPLEYSIKNESLPFIISLLDSNKIDFSVKLNNNHETYLHLAARSINVKIFTELRNRNLGDINAKDDLDKTPYDYRKIVDDSYQNIINDMITKTKYSSFRITREFIDENYDLLIEFLCELDDLNDWNESCIDDFISYVNEANEE